MQSVSNAFLTAQQSSTPMSKGYFTINGTAQNEYIVSMDVRQELCSGGQFSVGNFNASSFTAQVFTQFVNVAVGDTLVPFFGFLTDSGTDTYEYVQKGVFRIPDTGIQQNGGFTTITAYDESYFWSGEYQTSLDFSGETAHFVSDIIDEIEQITNKTVVVDSRIDPTTIPVRVAPTGEIRSVIGYVAGLCGCNAIMGNTGDIEFRKPLNQTLELDTSAYGQGGLVLESDSATAVVCVNTGDFSAPEGHSDQGIFVEFNSEDITEQSDANLLASRIGITSDLTTTMTYRGYTLNTLVGYPQVDVGDIIHVTDIYDVSTPLYILSSGITWNGGMTTSFSANVPLENKVKRMVLGGVTQAAEKAEEAVTLARESYRIANNTDQYFWFVPTEYFLSADTTVVDGKNYYELTQEGYQLVTPTGNENPASLGWYEMVSDTGAHITRVPQDDFLADPTNGGGNLLARSDGVALRVGMTEKANFTANGVNILDSNGSPIAHYGDTAQIGSTSGFHIEIDGQELGFYQGGTKVAYLSNNTLHISKSVVLNEMQVGETKWTWRIDKNDDSIYLKWIGGAS